MWGKHSITELHLQPNTLPSNSSFRFLLNENFLLNWASEAFCGEVMTPTLAAFWLWAGFHSLAEIWALGWYTDLLAELFSVIWRNQVVGYPCLYFRRRGKKRGSDTNSRLLRKLFSLNRRDKLTLHFCWLVTGWYWWPQKNMLWLLPFVQMGTFYCIKI